MSQQRYIVSSPSNDWEAFEITVSKGLVVEKSRGGDVTVGADFNSLKKHLWADGKKYKVTEVKD
jgi:hypothetical protein